MLFLEEDGPAQKFCAAAFSVLNSKRMTFRKKNNEGTESSGWNFRKSCTISYKRRRIFYAVLFPALLCAEIVIGVCCMMPLSVYLSVMY